VPCLPATAAHRDRVVCSLREVALVSVASVGSLDGESPREEAALYSTAIAGKLAEILRAPA
jgi:hypothetical protein